MTPLGSLIHDTNNIIGNLRNRASVLEINLRDKKEVDIQKQIDFLKDRATKLSEIMDKFYLIQKEKGERLF